MSKIIIAGGRDFDNPIQVEDAMNIVLAGFMLEPSEVIIVSGTARGADRCGEAWAETNGCQVVKLAPDWDMYGKSAGFVRNNEMAKFADILVAFWDGKSKGTKHMIDTMGRIGKIVLVFPYE